MKSIKFVCCLYSFNHPGSIFIFALSQMYHSNGLSFLKNRPLKIQSQMHSAGVIESTGSSPAYVSGCR